jgi:hypothetical protein
MERWIRGFWMLVGFAAALSAGSFASSLDTLIR